MNRVTTWSSAIKTLVLIAFSYSCFTNVQAQELPLCPGGHPPKVPDPDDDAGVVHCAASGDGTTGGSGGGYLIGGGSLSFLSSLMTGGKGFNSSSAGASPGSENTGDSKCGSGNPIDLATGNKVQLETDFVGHGVLPLKVVRTYNSSAGFLGEFGNRWSSSLSASLSWKNESFDRKFVTLKRADGKIVTLKYDDNAWRYMSGEYASLSLNDEGFWIYIEDNLLETYSPSGNLKSVRATNGEKLTYVYQNSDGTGRLVRLEHNSGQNLRFEYNSDDQIIRFFDPANNKYEYTYNSGNLMSVSYPAINGTAKRQYTYNSFAQLIRIDDAAGRAYAQWEYHDGRAVKSYHGSHQEISQIVSFVNVNVNVGPNAGTRVVTERNALGKDTVYTFKNHQGNWQVSNIAGQEKGTCLAANQKYTYDENGLPDTVSDWEGNITDYDYNTIGRLMTYKDAMGNVTSFEYGTNLYGNPTKITTALNEVTMSYDSTGRMIHRTKKNISNYGNIGEERTWTYSYTEHANGLTKTLTIDGPRTDVSDVTITEFTSQGFVSKITNALGQDMTFSQHNVFGNPGRAVTPDGKVTLFTYHPRGWLLTRTESANDDARTTTLTYDKSGLLTHSQSPAGVGRFYVYDNARRLVRVTDGNIDNLGIKEYSYDVASNITMEKVMRQQRVPVPCNGGGWQMFGGSNEFSFDLPSFGYCSKLKEVVHKTSRQYYDSLNRLTKTLDSLQTVGAYTYNKNNRLTKVTDGKGNPTKYIYDALNRKTVRQDRSGNIVSYTYNAHSKLIRVVDSKRYSTIYDYDGFDQLVKKSSPDTGVTTYSYDKAGNLIRMTDEKNTVTTRTLDALNRVTSESSGSIKRSFSYDTARKGYLYRVTDESGIQTHTYNVHGELTKRTDALSGINFSTEWSYNKDGRIKSIQHPNGMMVSYSYDSLCQIKEVKSNNNVLLKDPVYKPFGPIESFKFGSNLRRIYFRDNRYRLSRLYAFGITDLRYTFDENNNISSVNNFYAESSNKLRNYSYDKSDRLASQSEYGVSTSFAYDANNNRTKNGPQNYVVSSVSNRLHSIPGKNYGYDSNGNVTRKGSQNFIYNDANRMIGYQSGSSSASYAYNFTGQRVVKDVNGIKTWFVYDVDGKLLYERSGQTQKSYIYRETEIVGYIKNNVLYYVHSDNTGRPEVITATNNARVWKSDNRAFGRNIKQDNIGGFNLGFPGQYWDAEKASYYNYFRDCDPETGRYLQSDPVGLDDGVNTYGYVHQNPMKYIDPKGKSGLHVLRSSYWVGGRIGAGINYGVLAVTGLSIGALIYDAVESVAEESDGNSSDGESCPSPEDIPTIDWEDSSKPPVSSNGKEWEWRGKQPQGGEYGGYVNPDNTDISVHPDMDHPDPIGSHWDYTDRKNGRARIYPDGTITPKK